MISVTQAARGRFARILEDVDLPEGMILRLDTAGNGGGPGIAMRVTSRRADDEPVEHGGEALFYVSIAVSAAYDGCVMDLIETPEGDRFGLGPPAAGHDAR